MDTDTPPRVFMPGYFDIDGEKELRNLTGGILYDRNVALGLRAGGFSVKCFDLDSMPRWVKSVKFPAAARLADAGGDFDVLVTDLGNSALTAGFQDEAGRRGRLTVLVCHHFRAGIEHSFLKKFMYRYTERKVVAGADLLVSNSRHTASKLESMGRSPGDIVLAPPGLNVQPASRPTFRTKPSHLVSVCTVEPRKGITDMVRAFHAAALPDVRFTLAGDTREGSGYTLKVRRLIETLGMSSRITLAGRLSAEGIRNLYESADVFMLLSRWEGYGMAIAEAMSIGLPVISTAAGAIPDLVVNGVNGILVPPGDWRRAAEALERLFGNTSLRKMLAESALETAGEFPSWEETTGKVVSAIKNRLHQPCRG